MAVEWIWDQRKDEANRKKHGLPLKAGIWVLENDPLHITVVDPHQDGNRLNTVGSVQGMVILMVVHTEPEYDLYHQCEFGRIISVRKATPHERKEYENGC